MQGDVVLVAMEYEDGWSRGMKLETKEVCASRGGYIELRICRKLG